MSSKARRAERRASKRTTVRGAGRTRSIHGHESNLPPIDHDATYEFQDGGQEDNEYIPRHEVSKSSNEGKTMTIGRVDRDAITLHNSQNCSLLKMPAEIRNYIWELAFGHRTVHPRALRGNVDWQPQRRRLQASKWGVSYDPCLEIQSEQELYELSLLNPESKEWHSDMHPECGAPGFHNCTKQGTPREFHYFVPPVCKQLWSEASDLAWRTTTFAFVMSGDFQHFVLFSGAPLHQIRQLCIISPGMDFFEYRPLSEKNKFDRGWARALRSSAMTRFTSLVGLNLVLRFFWGTSAWDTRIVEDLEYPPDECLYLPEIVRVFQQFHLHPERTTVLITNAIYNEAYGYADFTVPKRRKMAEVIRNFILQPTPDRDWNGPGQRMVIWSDRNVASEHS